jgi:hypothetical protein
MTSDGTSSGRSSEDLLSVVSAEDKGSPRRPLHLIKDPSVVAHVPRGPARQNEVVKPALEIPRKIPIWLVAEFGRDTGVDLFGTKLH